MKKILFVVLLFGTHYLNAQIFIGNASDPMSAISIHPMLDCNPQLNMVSFVYASTPAGGVPKLYTNYSYSSGDTWQNAGNIIYNNTSSVNASQYPNAFIYNPAGNTIADSSYIHWSSPTGSAGNYQAYRFGSTHPFILPSATLNTASVSGSNIPEDGLITQQGETYFLFPPVPSGSLTISDSMSILHGVWDPSAGNMNYTTSYLKMPLDLDSNNVFEYRTGGIAFGNDGLTGYIYLMAHHEFSIINDSTFYPIIYKTTDAGLTWSAPQVLSLDNCHNLLLTSVTGKYSAGYEVDGTVDANGNLHFVTAVAPLLANNKMDVHGGQWGLFDIYTNDGGTTWNAELLNKPQTNNVSYPGGLYTYSRAQASKTWNGDHLFFGWFDTDTLTFGTLFNTHPNLFVKAFDVNTQLWTTTVNKTSATGAASLCLFATIAPYVLESGLNYELPVSAALGSSGLTSPSNYFYLNNLLIDSTTFTQTGSPVVLSSTSVALQESENMESIVSEIYPNPAKDYIDFYVIAKKETSISYSLVNSVGQVIQSVNNQKLKAARNNFNLNTKALSSGIYFLQISMEGKNISRKLVIGN